MDTGDVAIVGAGISGLRCARVLQDAGVEVRLFDKGGAGGRLSTHRTAEATFDHGVQFFTARSAGFRDDVEAWTQREWVARWMASVADVWTNERRIRTLDYPRWVGVPTMNRLPQGLAEGLDVTCHTQVSAVSKVAGRWRLHDAQQRVLGNFERVVVTTPAGQAGPLLAGCSSLQVRTEAIEMRPCWAVMVVPEQPLDLEFDAAHFHELPISWAARQASKPGRPDDTAWVLHASARWTQEHWDDAPESVVAAMVATFSTVLGVEVGPLVHGEAHRWRYALAGAPLPARCLYDAATGLGACGDWCGGPRVEGAYVSGGALARRMLTA